MIHYSQSRGELERSTNQIDSFHRKGKRMIMLLLYFLLYANNTKKNYNNPGTNRAIYLSQSFSRK